MYQIKVYHHELSKDLNRLSFPDKRQANKWLKDNTDKRGYNFFDKEDRSVEYQKQY